MIGLADFALGPPLLTARPGGPWMTARAALNLVIAHQFRANASVRPGLRRACTGAIAMTDWPPVPDAPFTFVFDGVESAVEQAKAAAGDHAVGVAGADIAQQCLNAGLLDEVRIDLVPVLLGSGIRNFDNLADTVELDDPTVTRACA